MYRGDDLWGEHIKLNMVRKVLSNGKTITTYQELPQNIFLAFKDTAKKHRKKIAVIDNEGRKYSYEKMLEMVNDFSAWLAKDFGISKGNHVALMLYNSIEFCTAFLALNRIGAVVVPLPTKFREEEIHALIQKSDVEFVISDQKFEAYFKNLYEKVRICIIPDGTKKYALSVLKSASGKRWQKKWKKK